jgi:ketosteroid isomerase-like protein
MSGQGRCRTATHWLVVIGLQLPALVLLQSCKNDRAKPVETAAHDPEKRAVFGSAPERVRSRVQQEGSKTSQPAIKADKSQERARRADPVASESRTAAGEPQRSRVKDPGERRVGDDEVAIASNRTPRAPVAERFLHYEPPGSRVGDAGELANPEPQISASAKPIRELIHRWADTLLNRDLRGHMSLYAPRVARFNGSSDVTRETVTAFKQRLLSGFAGVQRFEIYNVRLSTRDGSVIAEFRIESDAAGQGIAGWYRLVFRQDGGQWKIYGEEKLQPVSRRSGR